MLICIYLNLSFAEWRVNLILSTSNNGTQIDCADKNLSGKEIWEDEYIQPFIRRTIFTTGPASEVKANSIRRSTAKIGSSFAISSHELLGEKNNFQHPKPRVETGTQIIWN